MTKRRITIIDTKDRDWDEVASFNIGFTVESVEDIPEPDRVQEFRIRVETRPCDVPVTADRIARLLSASISWPSNYAVTEVAP